MNNINLQVLKNIFTSNRAKSLYWRTGMMFIAAIIQITIDSLTDFQLSGTMTVFVGLILGEISKSINKALQEEI